MQRLALKVADMIYGQDPTVRQRSNALADRLTAALGDVRALVVPVRLAKVIVEPSVTDSPAIDEYSQPHDAWASLPAQRVTLGDQVLIIRHRLIKSDYMRKWREANPEFARQRTREAVATRRARKAASG